MILAPDDLVGMEWPTCPIFRRDVGFIRCGYCLECRKLERLYWAIRIDAEARCHDRNCMLNLTYDDEHVPEEVERRPLQLMWKSFRKKWPVRYFLGSEYGEMNGRPHYHAAVFDVDRFHPCFHNLEWLPKKRIWFGDMDYWHCGKVGVGTLTSASAQYCAKYILKSSDEVVYGYSPKFKRIGFWAKRSNRAKEFRLMSRRPGIGFPYLALYGDEMLARDSYVLDGQEVPIPPYFKKKLLSDAQRATIAEEWYLESWNKINTVTKQELRSDYEQRIRILKRKYDLFGKKGVLDDQSKNGDQDDRLFMLGNSSFS